MVRKSPDDIIANKKDTNKLITGKKLHKKEKTKNISTT